jgi:hypothetical protein
LVDGYHVRISTLLGGLNMDNFVSRQEFDDMIRHLTTKADRAQQQAACAMEEAKCLSAALAIVSFQIRQLTTWLVPLLSAEQQEAIGVESRAGVTDVDAGEVNSIEPNDGQEWRERLRQRGGDRRPPSMMTAQQGAAMTKDEVESFKSLGSTFIVKPNDAGPCYNRDNRPPSML